MKKTIVVSFLLLAFAIFSGLGTPGTARADMHHHAMMMHGGPIAFYLINQDRLGLTSDQVQKLQNLKMNFMKTMILEKAQIKVIHIETMALMMKYHVDVDRVNHSMDALLKHKRTIMHSYTSMIAKAHSILTDEQFTSAKKLWRETMMMHHGMMMHPPHHHGM
jgi:hypothetical protein